MPSRRRSVLARVPCARPLLPQQPGLLPQLPRLVDRRAAVLARTDEDETVGSASEDSRAKRVGRPAGDDQVGGMLRERSPHRRAVADLHPHPRPGMLSPESGDEREQETLSRRGHSRHPHGAPARLFDARRCSGTLFEQPERLAHSGGECGARIGETQPAALPGNEVDAELRRSSRADGRRHRGLGDHQPLGGTAHRTGFRHCQERP